MERRPFNLDEIRSPELSQNLEWTSAAKATEKLNQAGYEAYVVGGAVRDLLLGNLPKDFDLCTNASPEQISELDFDRTTFVDAAQAYGVSRVRVSGVDLELATFRRDVDAHLGRHNTKVEFNANLEDDVMRRDLTINAIALDVAVGQLVDYVGGLDDLDAGIIRFVGEAESRIAKDPLRILRAVRFKNKLGFEYDPDTKATLIEAVNDGMLEQISPERIATELTNLLRNAKSRRAAIEDLDQLGILEHILPDLVACKGVKQGRKFHAEGDVWTHNLLIMEALGEDASPELIWAALLHDIGKPNVKYVEEAENHITFYGHAEKSVQMARDILNTLKFSNTQKDNILWIIAHHINIKDLPQMRPSKQKKMMGHPMFAELVEHFRADGEASWQYDENGDLSHQKPNYDEVLALWDHYRVQPLEHRHPSIKRDLGIDGHWLIEEFGSGFDTKIHGQVIGRVMKQLEQLYADGEITEAQIARAKARQLLEIEKHN